MVWSQERVWGIGQTRWDWGEVPQRQIHRYSLQLTNTFSKQHRILIKYRFVADYATPKETPQNQIPRLAVTKVVWARAHPCYPWLHH